jgi:hypothetical protein
MRKEYTSDTINQIWADVQEVQESGIGRKILPKDLDYAAKKIESQPYGEIIIHAQCARKDFAWLDDDVQLNVSWYSWRHKKYIRWRVGYMPIDKQEDFDPEGHRLPVRITELLGKENAWCNVFGERWYRYRHLKLKRQLIHEGYMIPHEADEVDVKGQYAGMILIKCKMPDGDAEYLCSPLGYIKVKSTQYPYMPIVVSHAGIELPDDAKTWEDAEPAWVMAQLRKL